MITIAHLFSLYHNIAINRIANSRVMIDVSRPRMEKLSSYEAEFECHISTHV